MEFAAAFPFPFGRCCDDTSSGPAILFKLLFLLPQKVPLFFFLRLKLLSPSARLPIMLSAPGVCGRVDEEMESWDEEVRVSS